MKGAVITVGDEILIGQIVNTNAAWIGAQLTALGLAVSDMITVGDDADAITEALTHCLSKAQVLIVTGGLGPTHDDITRSVVAELFEADLQTDESILARVRSRWENRGLDMPNSNHTQALVPEGFEAIPNEAGTAPALISQNGERLLVLLPGVPFEMKKFMIETVLPRVEGLPGMPERAQKTLHTVGIGESDLHDKLEGVSALLDAQRSLAYLPNISGLRLRLTTVGDDSEERLVELEEWIRSRAKEWIYGEGDTSLEEEVGKLLKTKGLTLSTAESCTGGLVAHKMTNIAGSSHYMVGGVVAYSNSIKMGMLSVEEQAISEHGAVSRQVACQMAEGVRKRMNTDIGLSTTGIMGPGGGTVDKPVGTIWIGISTSTSTSAVRLQLRQHRLRNKERAATGALNVLRKVLSKKKNGPKQAFLH